MATIDLTNDDPSQDMIDLAQVGQHCSTAAWQMSPSSPDLAVYKQPLPALPACASTPLLPCCCLLPLPDPACISCTHRFKKRYVAQSLERNCKAKSLGELRTTYNRMSSGCSPKSLLSISKAHCWITADQQAHIYDICLPYLVPPYPAALDLPIYIYIFIFEFLDSTGTAQVQHRSLSLFIYTAIHTLGLSSPLSLPPPLLCGNLPGKHPSTRHGHESSQHLAKSAVNEYIDN